MAFEFSQDSVVEIPIDPTIPFQSITIPLSGSSYKLSFKYNTRLDTWFMDILSSNGSQLLSGCKLCLGVLISESHTIEGLPPGVFVLVDSKDTTEDEFGRYELGSGRRVRLVYGEISQI